MRTVLFSFFMAMTLLSCTHEERNLNMYILIVTDSADDEGNPYKVSLTSIFKNNTSEY